MGDFTTTTTFDPSIASGIQLYGLAPGDEGWNMRDASAAWRAGGAHGEAIDAAQAQQNNNNDMIGAGIQTAAMMTPWGRVGSLVGNAIKPIAKGVLTPKPSPGVIGSTIQGGGRSTATQTNYATQPYSGLTNAHPIGTQGSITRASNYNNRYNDPRNVGGMFNKRAQQDMVKGTGKVKKDGPLSNVNQGEAAKAANLKRSQDAMEKKRLEIAQANAEKAAAAQVSVNETTTGNFVAKQIKALWEKNRNFDAVDYLKHYVGGTGGNMTTQEAKNWLIKHKLRQPGPIIKKPF